MWLQRTRAGEHRQSPTFTSENTKPGRRGRAPVDLTGPYATVLDEYVAALGSAPLAEQTRRTYASKVRQYLAWLGAGEFDDEPLSSADGRDWAVRDYRTPASGAQAQAGDRQQRARRRRRSLHPPRLRPGQSEARRDPERRASRARGEGETVALDLDDVRLSARKGVLRILGKGERVREVPIHEKLRKALDDWLQERRDWPAAAHTPALFLNQLGRLSPRGAHAVITGIAARAGLEDHVTAHVLRHSFATTLVRGNTDLIVAAELLGHARLETTRAYSRPTAEDRRKAVDLLPVDE